MSETPNAAADQGELSLHSLVDAGELPEAVTARLESTPEQMIAAVVGALPASRDTISVTESDERWPGLFDSFAAELKRVLGEAALHIDHVGSTAVPGLAAKPIIDIDVTVRDSEIEDDYVPALVSAGYLMVIREPWWHGHRMFVDGSGAVNLHVWPIGAAEPIRHLLFRNWLRENADDRERYARMKKELSRELVDEPDRYNLAKNAVIDDIYARIFAERARAVESPTAKCPMPTSEGFTS